MKHGLLVNYNFDPQDWWLEYGIDDMTMYDRSDDGVERTFAAKTYRTPNIGNVDYDKLGYLVENYDTLPDVFLWGKSNLFKYISKEEFEKVKDNQGFTPLLTQHHQTYLDNSLPGGGLNIVSMYRDGMYHERHGIVNTLHTVLSSKHFTDWQSWCEAFNVPFAGLIPFPPGGNFILTKERVHRYARDFYREMMDTMDYATTPVEAQFAERSYYLLWK